MSCLGTCRDSKLASLSGLVFPRLDDAMSPPGFALLGDSVFITCNINGKNLRSRKYTETSDILQSSALAAAKFLMQHVMLRKRQSAEWGVRALEVSFGILCVPLISDASRRYRSIAFCVRLLNLRAKLVGPSQIHSVYASPITSVPLWAQRIFLDSFAV